MEVVVVREDDDSVCENLVSGYEGKRRGFASERRNKNALLRRDRVVQPATLTFVLPPALTNTRIPSFETLRFHSLSDDCIGVTKLLSPRQRPISEVDDITTGCLHGRPI